VVILREVRILPLQTSMPESVSHGISGYCSRMPKVMIGFQSDEIVPRIYPTLSERPSPLHLRQPWTSQKECNLRLT
jgi:hypothetical protein